MDWGIETVCGRKRQDECVLNKKRNTVLERTEQCCLAKDENMHQIILYI